ncbi:MAG: hypothetical protein C0507_13995 [Cyanobacteria bacterium PR.3.49]|nr:hypothetical protein [Cyanobacteria bacterium PR.3.49]
MGKDWFTKTTWTKDDQLDFEKRLQRTKNPVNKAQYLRIQASYLEESEDANLLEAALSLLVRSVQQFPNDLQMPWTCEQIARCNEKLGRIDETITAYQAALAAQRQSRSFKNNSEILFARFVIRNKLFALYECAETYLPVIHIDDFALKIEIYYNNACRAIFANQRGDFTSAKSFALKSLEAFNATDSGLARHKSLGLVKDTNPEFYALICSLAK